MSKLNRDSRGMPIPPRKDWPMNAHPNGQWYRKKGKRPFYFGPWDEWRAAEENFDWRWPFISAGKADPQETTADQPAAESGTLHYGCNLFLASKLADRDAGRIVATHFASIKRWLAHLLDFEPADKRGTFRHRKIESITPAQWEQFGNWMDDNFAPISRKNMIGMYHECFTWVEGNGHGPAPTAALRAPTKLEMRNAARAKSKARGEMILPREQVKPILDACDMPLDAMFLLGLNTGSIAADVAALRLDELDLDKGEFKQERAKTGVERFVFLWPETVKALRDAIANRPAVNKIKLAEAVAEWKKLEPKSGKEARRKWEAGKPEWDKLVFLTKYGQPWVRMKITGEKMDNASYYEGVGLEFRKVLKRLDKRHKDGKGGLAFKRDGISFKVCRHTFYSAARRIDLDGARYSMGHVDESMGAWYDHLDDTKLSILREISDWTRYVFLGQTSEGHAGFRLRLAGLATDAVAAAG